MQAPSTPQPPPPAPPTLLAAIEARCRPHGADDRDVADVHRACVAFCGAAEVGHATLARWLADRTVLPWWITKTDIDGERYLAVELTEAGTLIWHCRVYADGVGYGRGRALLDAATAPGGARRIAAAQDDEAAS